MSEKFPNLGQIMSPKDKPTTDSRWWVNLKKDKLKEINIRHITFKFLKTKDEEKKNPERTPYL